MVEKEHHVAWADRVGLTKIWYTDMQVCSANFGGRFYPVTVDRLEQDMVNIRDGPKLTDEIDDYKKTTLDSYIEKKRRMWIMDNPQQSQNQSYIRDINMVLKQERAKLLHKFIKQLLENNGFGMYKSTVEEDEMI